MSCGEIIERAKFSPQYKPDNYKQTSNSIHYEKVVVRNLMKIIPKISVELQSTLSLEYSNEIENTSYDDVTEKVNKLEEAKKNISEVVSTEPDKLSTEPEAPKTEAAKYF
jgi:hypothetical protein